MICAHVYGRTNIDILGQQLTSYFISVYFDLIWFLTSHQQSFSYVETGPVLSSDAGEAQTRSPSVLSQALYHWATVLPLVGYEKQVLIVKHFATEYI